MCIIHQLRKQRCIGVRPIEQTESELYPQDVGDHGVDPPYRDLSFFEQCPEMRSKCVAGHLHVNAGGGGFKSGLTIVGSKSMHGQLRN